MATLLLGRREFTTTERAVAILERTCQRLPHDSSVRSDLAAARLERAKWADDPYELILALSDVERAVADDPKNAEARFNRALISEHLSLRLAARREWQEYLGLDPASRWADEARAHLRALEALGVGSGWPEASRALVAAADRGAAGAAVAIIARFPRQASEYVGETLLGAWGEQWRAGQVNGAEHNLSLARRLAGILAARHGETLLADAVATIDGLSSSRQVGACEFPRRRPITELAEAHQLYRDARRRYLNGQADTLTKAMFTRARSLLQARGSPFELWPALHVAIASFHGLRLHQAAEQLEAITRDPRARGSTTISARVLWMMGLVRLAEGDPEAALTAYREALILADRDSDGEASAQLNGLLAEAFLYLGEERESFNHLFRSLVAIGQIAGVRRLAPILVDVAQVASAGGQQEVARSFYDELVQLELQEWNGALPADYAAQAALACVESASASSRLGDKLAMERSFAQARAFLSRVSDQELRRRAQAELLIADSQSRLPAGPREAASVVTSLSRAIDFYRGRGHRAFLSGLFRARALAFEALGDQAGAEADLRSGLGELELQRGKVPDEGLRISLFQQARSLFDGLIALLIDQHRCVEAFEVAERARARALLDRLELPNAELERTVTARARSAPLTLSAVQRQLPADVAILEYRLLSDRQVIWLVTRSDFFAEELTSASPGVEKDAARFSRLLALRAADAQTRPLAERLYDRLIRPVQPRLSPRTSLLLVPDEGLQGLPFGALLDRSSGRYLIENRVLAVFPSASAYVSALHRRRVLAAGGRPPRVLAVGNPTFDTRMAPGLATLPESEREAADFAALFAGSRLLIGKSATKGRFLDMAGRYEIVVFAGHAVVDTEKPLLSRLLFAPDLTGESGLLYAHQLLRARFARTSLAVLTACSSATGPSSGEGLMGLARAFLAAGVPSVIAGLWDVEDNEARLFAHALAVHLRAGDEPAPALRAAQLDLLHGDDLSTRSPSLWAAFQSFGPLDSQGGPSQPKIRRN